MHLENGPRSLTLEKAENSQEPAGILVRVRPSGLSCQLGCSWRSQPSPALSPLWPWTSLWGLQPPCPSSSLSHLIYAGPTHRSPGMFGAPARAQVTSLLLNPAPQDESGWEWVRLGHTLPPSRACSLVSRSSCVHRRGIFFKATEWHVVCHYFSGSFLSGTGSPELDSSSHFQIVCRESAP